MGIIKLDKLKLICIFLVVFAAFSCSATGGGSPANTPGDNGPSNPPGGGGGPSTTLMTSPASGANTTLNVNTTSAKNGDLYEVNVTPGNYYNITISNKTGNNYTLNVYPNLVDFVPVCSSANAFPQNDTCILNSGALSVLYIEVAYYNVTGSYTLTVTNMGNGAGYTGTTMLPEPMGEALNVTTVNGTVTAGSDYYYMIPVVPTSHNYSVTLTGLSGNADLYVYSNSIYSTLKCSSVLAGTSNETCSPVYPAQNYLYIDVRNMTAGSITFTLTVTDNTPGIASNPQLTSDPLHGYIHLVNLINNDYYYKVPVTAGSKYRVDLTLLISNLDIYVYDNAAYNTLLCSSTNTGSTSESCTTGPVSGPYMYVVIKNYAPYGSNMVLHVLYAQNPGDAGSPVAVTTPGVGSSSVINGSITGTDNFYYKVPVSNGYGYQFDLISLSANYDLAISLSDTILTYSEKNKSARTGLTDEICARRQRTESFYYIKIINTAGASGTFSLKVSNNGTIPNVATSNNSATPMVLTQATAGTPMLLPLTLNPATLNYGMGDMFYSIPVAASTTYTFTLFGSDNYYSMNVYTTPDYVTTVACYGSGISPANEVCSYTTPASGVTNLYISVLNNTSPGEGAYGILVTTP